ncbi:hypothetical protein K457DRAFT_26222 [Linnemannia elongata AG-77]|uniref:F-box domain-containing protein n=1 Tax=Linnemannia elongata AG-77 TaxID=1314771 RepID=A0A197JB79_9FUNG|nr:hypothetical protein K457DRAFT_1882574 [Linnemannia elongata AG-77]OAQ22293.1 hypothetical protein K457DRAFT_26222 [Linnemannia elongata AG-77]
MDFAGPVWYTIDFDKDDSFFQIPPEVIVRYGRYIRKAIHVAKEVDILSLLNPGITALTNLEVSVSHNRFSLVLFQDLVRCHRPSLTTLRITGDMIPTRTFDEQKKNGVYLSLDAIGPSWRLTALTLFEPGPLPPPRFESLESTRNQVCGDEGPLPDAQPSLLVHFPALIFWNLTGATVDLFPKLRLLHATLQTYCPDLKRVLFIAPNPHRIADTLEKVFVRLEACAFKYRSLTTDVVMGLLEHSATLRSIIMAPSVVKVEIHAADEVASSKRMVGRLLRSCHRLEVLSVKGHMMDVKFLEEQELECRGTLKELRGDSLLSGILALRTLESPICTPTESTVYLNIITAQKASSTQGIRSLL